MHGLSSDEEIEHWRSQARHWQRETERVRSLQDSHEARLVELFIAAHAGPVEIAADMSGEVARVVNAIRINVVCRERAEVRLADAKHALANAEQAAMLSDEDAALLAAIRAELTEMGMTALVHHQLRDPAFRFRSRDHEDEENAELTRRALAALDRLLSRGKDGR